jgi:hypothetical protein
MSELEGSPPCPKSRSPRSGWNHPRANRNIVSLNNAELTLSDLQAQRLSREFALSRPFADIVASLHFGGAER